MTKLIIIAEAGVNHNGSLKRAMQLVEIAAIAKADFIKFQTYFPEELVQKKFGCANYQKKNSNFKDQYKMLEKYKLSFKDHIKIQEKCKSRGIKFLSSPFDIGSINLLTKLKLKTIKVPSGEINNIPYLEKLGQLNKKIILSTGMSTIKEIKLAIKTLTKSGTNKSNISLLHCSTEYPVSLKNTNLKSIKYLRDIFNLKVGYSDHTEGFEAALIAIGLGAQIIEKHFTINKKLNGPDHKASLGKEDLLEFVQILREANKSLGGYHKKPSLVEIQNSKFVRKNIVAKQKIKKGEKFTSNNLTTKRAKPGISASKWKKVLNKKSKYNFIKDQNIKI